MRVSGLRAFRCQDLGLRTRGSFKVECFGLEALVLLLRPRLILIMGHAGFCPSTVVVTTTVDGQNPA